jgi:crotonobetainyl-CoA:carnitine CoA-transferase CaiB-like acyl-CoA transferase
MTSGVKPWWKSKTIWAALGVFVMTVAPELGIGIDSDDAVGIGGAVGDIATGALALFAIIGRLRAKQRIGRPSPTDPGA